MSSPASSTQLFGQLLVECRQHARLSQEELAERAGLSIRALRDLERGRTRFPHPDSVRRLADALGLTGCDRESFEREAPRRIQIVRPTVSPRAGLRPIEPQHAAWPPSNSPPRAHAVPARNPNFVGRGNELTMIQEAIERRLSGTDQTPQTIVISGEPGIGKTELALQVAHLAHDRFRGGIRYVDLRDTRFPGSWPQILPVDASRAKPARLLVLDGAEWGTFLPGVTAGYSTVLVTRRGAAPEGSIGFCVPLRPLTPEAAARLMISLVGPDRIASDPGAGRRLIACCGCQPRALHVLGAWICARPDRPLASLAAVLDLEQQGLGDLVAERFGQIGNVDIGLWRLMSASDGSARPADTTRPDLE